MSNHRETGNEEDEHCRRLKAHLNRNRIPFYETKTGNALTIDVRSRPMNADQQGNDRLIENTRLQKTNKKELFLTILLYLNTTP